MPHIRILSRLALEWGLRAVQLREIPNDQLFLQAAYRTLFKREPDREGYEDWYGKLQQRQMTKLQVLKALLAADEFKQVYGLRMHPLEVMHRTRMQFVQQCLPAAKVIVDLGGAANQYDAGALLMLGYPHHPETIYIVDLPPEARFVGSTEPEQVAHGRELVAHDAINICYLYQSMADPLPLPDDSVDLVFSGESIEHITEADADAVCREAYRVLKHDGSFVLDTPNAALTRLQSPDKLIHPEHKQEYHPHELRSKLEQWGFEVVEEGAICPMPDSLRTHTFSYRELVTRMGLSQDPNEGYMFYLKAVKPPVV